MYIYIYIYICFSVILLDSSFRTGKSCNLQVLLEECKCVIKDNKNDKYIIDDVEFLLILMKKGSWKKFRWKKILIIKKFLMQKF